MNDTITTTPTAQPPADDSKVIVACALSSVAMVCLVAAMLYFRVTVLRREKTLNEIRRLEALARRGESRAVSRTSSSASRLSMSKSWPGGSFRRQFSHPPRSPRSELRRDSLHTIPNGLGVRATIEPPCKRLGCASTEPERASSYPDEVQQTPGGSGVPRRASWSFENPVFDQWVPPLTKPTDDEDDVFSQTNTVVDPDGSFIVLDPQLSGDKVSLAPKETDDDTTSSSKDGGLRKHQKLPRISGYSGSSLYLRHDDYPLSMPTLHEREDSSSSGGNEKATETETTANGQPVINGSRTRSESSC